MKSSQKKSGAWLEARRIAEQLGLVGATKPANAVRAITDRDADEVLARIGAKTVVYRFTPPEHSAHKRPPVDQSIRNHVKAACRRDARGFLGARVQ